MAPSRTQTTVDPTEIVVLADCRGCMAILEATEVADYVKGVLIVAALAIPTGLLMLAWGCV